MKLILTCLFIVFCLHFASSQINLRVLDYQGVTTLDSTYENVEMRVEITSKSKLLIHWTRDSIEDPDYEEYMINASCFQNEEIWIETNALDGEETYMTITINTKLNYLMMEYMMHDHYYTGKGLELIVKKMRKLKKLNKCTEMDEN